MQDHGIADVLHLEFIDAQHARAWPPAAPPPGPAAVRGAACGAERACTSRIRCWKCRRRDMPRLLRRGTGPSARSCRGRPVPRGRSRGSRVRSARPARDAAARPQRMRRCRRGPAVIQAVRQRASRAATACSCAGSRACDSSAARARSAAAAAWHVRPASRRAWQGEKIATPGRPECRTDTSGWRRGEIRRDAFHQVHGAMLAAGAADGHGEVAAIAGAELGNARLDEPRDVLDQPAHAVAASPGTATTSASRPVRPRSAGSQ